MVASEASRRFAGSDADAGVWHLQSLQDAGNLRRMALLLSGMVSKRRPRGGGCHVRRAGGSEFQVRCFCLVSLRNPVAQAELLKLAHESPPHVVLTMQSFSICMNDARSTVISRTTRVPRSASAGGAWQPQSMGRQRRRSASGRNRNECGPAGNRRTPARHGRGFKENDQLIPEVQFSVKRLAPDLSQIAYVAGVGSALGQFASTRKCRKKVAVILSNYPNRDGRIGNGVGLDTPASTVNLLRALRAEGYLVEPVPENGEELMQWLQGGITNDPEHSYGKPCRQTMDRVRLESFLGTLPVNRREELDRNWRLTFSDDIPVAGMQVEQRLCRHSTTPRLFVTAAGRLSQSYLAATA